MPRTRMTIPSLFSQFVPSISSTSRDDLKRSASDGPDSTLWKFGEGGGATGVARGEVGRSVVDEVEEDGVGVSIGSCVGHCSATRCAGTGATTGGASDGVTIFELGNGGVYEVATGLWDVLGGVSF